jgi:hypothetical protein
LANRVDYAIIVSPSSPPASHKEWSNTASES